MLAAEQEKLLMTKTRIAILIFSFLPIATFLILPYLQDSIKP